MSVAKAGALALPVFRKKATSPQSCPIRPSRSPSPSMSTKEGDAAPIRFPRPKGLVEAAAKTGALGLPRFRKKNVLPSSLPAKASRSPSASMSAKAGEAELPASGRSLGPGVKAGVLAVPVFRKWSVVPSASPTKASRSPSASMSAKAGCRQRAGVGDAERVERGRREFRRGRRPRVLEEVRVAVGRAGEDVEVAVAVDVREGRLRVVEAPVEEQSRLEDRRPGRRGLGDRRRREQRRREGEPRAGARDAPPGRAIGAADAAQPRQLEAGLAQDPVRGSGRHASSHPTPAEPLASNERPAPPHAPRAAAPSSSSSGPMPQPGPAGGRQLAVVEQAGAVRVAAAVAAPVDLAVGVVVEAVVALEGGELAGVGGVRAAGVEAEVDAAVAVVVEAVGAGVGVEQDVLEQNDARVWSPTSTSRSPSPSTSALSGEERVPTSTRPKGFTSATAKAGAASRARVLEEARVAVVGADEDVEIAVAVDVGEVGRRARADVHEAEGVRAAHREGRSRGRARVRQVGEAAVDPADERVGVAVGIEVAEGREARARQAEGLGAPPPRTRERPLRRCSRRRPCPRRGRGPSRHRRRRARPRRRSRRRGSRPTARRRAERSRRASRSRTVRSRRRGCRPRRRGRRPPSTSASAGVE